MQVSKQPFRVLLRVRYGESDYQGVVFNARYVDYVDVAMTEYFRVVYGGYEEVVAEGIETQVVNVNVSWSSSAKPDDVLAIDIGPARIGNTSIGYQLSIVERDSERPIASADITYVVVDAQTYQKRAIPDNMRQRLVEDGAGLLVDMSGSVSQR